MAKKIIPIACNLNDAEFRTRRNTILKEFKDGMLATTELRNGYRFSFPKAEIWIKKLSEMIILESECCPFLNFKLKIEAGKDSIFLEMTGQKGTKEFVSTLFV